MTTTITTAADNAAERTKSTGTAPDPTTLELEDYVRRGFVELIGILPPVVQTAVTLTGTSPRISGSLSANRVFYVQNGTRILAPGEWGFISGTLYVDRGAATAGDPVSAFHTTVSTMVLDPDGTQSTTVNTTCIFGLDWLEEGAILYAIVSIYRALHRVGRSNNPTGYLEAIQQAKEEYQEWVKNHMKVWDNWKEEMDGRLNLRYVNNDAPFLESPLAHFENASFIVPTYGRRSTMPKT